MKILITGAKGFLGSIIADYFIKNNHEVISLGRGSENDIQWDLAESKSKLIDLEIDYLIHCAGKAHSIPKNEIEEKEFFKVNSLGTKNLLDSLNKVKGVIYISSVAVYGKSQGELINEESDLLPDTVYGKSKLEAENYVRSWCYKNDVDFSILRLPLLVGFNPPGNLGAMIKGIKKGYYFNIGRGDAQKSMVLANDIPPILIDSCKFKTAFNLTDGFHPSFKDLSLHIARQLGKNNVMSIPDFMIKLFLPIFNLLGNKFPINTEKYQKITATLTFDDKKARKDLLWKPTKVLEASFV